MPRVSTTKSLKFHKLLEKLKASYPNIIFSEADSSSWNHKNKCITYNTKAPHASADLLHEIGHMKCDHISYSSDISLLKKELQAWEMAKDIGKDLNISISENYINNCLDSYRKWIYKRSLCPVCSQHAIEISSGSYRCINCFQNWEVGPKQTSRIYKKT